MEPPEETQEGEPSSTREEAPAVAVATLPFLLWYLSEESWLAIALLNQLCCSRLHTKKGVRALALVLPVEPPDSGARQRVWRRLCLGAMVFGEESSTYAELAELPARADAEIRRDICRTFPGRMSEPQTEALFRILRAVSHRLEDIGYCQGMNFIAGTFMRVFGVEGEAQKKEALVYQCICSILLRHGMNQYFGDHFPKLRLTALQFDCLVEAFLPDVSAAFERFNLSAEFYATQWFLTLFSYSLPASHAVRVWDQFFCRGMKFVHRVGLALLSEARGFLTSSSFDETVQRLRSLGQTTALSPEELVASAMEFKVTNRLLSELEHAMATGEGAQELPVCFPERDLDSGRTVWRLHRAPASTAAAGSASGDAPFLADALPAPRIPADPLAPVFPCLEACGPSTEGAAAQKAKGRRGLPKAVLPKAVLQKIRSKAAAAAAKEPSPSDAAHPREKGSSASRSSSMPALRRKKETASETAVEQDLDPLGASAPGAPGAVPKHLLPFVAQDLSTGEWVLLSNPEPSDKAKRKSWASKQVRKLRPGRAKQEKEEALAAPA